MTILLLTDKELRYLDRRRKTWHRLLRQTWYVFSGVAVFAVLFVPTIVYVQAQKLLAYQNSIEAVHAVARTGTRPTFFIPANQYADRFIENNSEESRLAADYVNLFMLKSDSLGLTADKRLGMDFDIEIAPCGLFGRRHMAASLSVYTSHCGCDTDTMIQKTEFRVDSSRNAIVVSSQEATLESLQP